MYKIKQKSIEIGATIAPILQIFVFPKLEKCGFYGKKSSLESWSETKLSPIVKNPEFLFISIVSKMVDFTYNSIIFIEKCLSLPVV